MNRNSTRARLASRGRRVVFSACLFATPLLAAPAWAAVQASDYYEDALRRFDARDAKGAIVQLKNALHLAPRHLPALVLLADAYLETGQAAAAETALRDAKKLGADRTVILPRLARVLQAQLKHQALLDEVVAEGLPPASRVEILLRRAQAHMALGQLKQAEQRLLEAERLVPGEVSVKVAQGTLMLRRGDLQAARGLAERAVKLAPGDAAAWNLKASVAHVAGDIPRALADYGKALAIDPDLVDARIGRVGLLMDQKRHGEAESELQSLQSYRVAEPRVAYLFALTAARRGEREATRLALTEVVTVLDRLPRHLLEGNAQLLMLGGLAHYGLGQAAKARTYLEGYIAGAPANLGARKLLANILLEQREYDAVIQLLYRGKADFSRDPQALSLLASAYMGKKQYQSATDLFEQAMRLRPDAAESAVGLGISHLGAGHVDAGIAQLQAVFAKDPGQAHAGLMLASTHLRRGEAAKAVTVARKVVANDPDNLTARNLLGSALVANQDRAAARVVFAEAARLQPGFLPVQFNIARLDLEAGDTQAARKRLLAILKVSTDHPEALLRLAQVESREGRPSEAVRWLKRARPGQPNALAPLLYLVERYLQMGDAKHALAVARELENAYPDNLGVLDALGQAYLAAGQVDKARATFSQMTRSAIFDSTALTRIAEQQMRIGAFEDAGFALKKALLARPDHLPAQLAMVDLDLAAGRPDAALQRARTLRGAHPALAASARALGQVYMARKQYAEAIAEFKAALAREPGAVHTLALFQAYIAAGQHQAGIDLIRAWLRAHPQDGAAHAALAEAYLHAGALSEARAAYEAALRIRGEDVGILNNLANILLRQEDPGALAYAQRAHALAPANPNVADTLGWILVRKGQAQEALPYLRDARLRAAGNPAIQYHLGAALLQLGRKAEAKRELQGALASGRRFEGMEDARALLRQR